MIKFELTPEALFEGCLLAALSHAICVGEYPELNYEHSWDGMNYCVNDSEGCRGTISFDKSYIVAVFRDEEMVDSTKDVNHYFEGAP